jgi:hypothetical protein
MAARPTKKKTAPTPLPEPQYEQRLILFLDFLGFKELVGRSTYEPGFLKRLIRAMDIVGELGADNGALFKSQQITQFSDSIVVSYQIHERSAVFWLLNEIALTVIRLAEYGFLVRGAVTVGLLYHSDRHVVGPAMNEAYRLESQIARYPRVLIDERVLKVARRSRSRQHSGQEEEGYARAFTTKDADGQFFFDYVSWDSVVDVTGGNNELYGRYLGTLGSLIGNGLRHDDPRVQEKFLWLQSQYAAAIKQVRSLPQDHKYRINNSALCAEIEALPTLKTDTKLAKAAVRKAQPTSKAKPVRKRKRKAKGS